MIKRYNGGVYPAGHDERKIWEYSGVTREAGESSTLLEGDLLGINVLQGPEKIVKGGFAQNPKPNRESQR